MVNESMARRRAGSRAGGRGSPFQSVEPGEGETLTGRPLTKRVVLANDQNVGRRPQPPPDDLPHV